MGPLDAIDISIIDALQAEGRLANLQLAERVALSPSACLRRLRRLEAEGIIDRYVAIVDRDAVGRATTVFVEISLESQRGEVLDAFEAAIRATPELMECYLMAGDGDYLVRLQCRDVADYERIHRHRLAELPGVARIRSAFALRTVVWTTALDVDGSA